MATIGRALAKAFSVSRIGAPEFSGSLGQIDHNQFTNATGMNVTPDGALRIAAAWIANTTIADEVSSLTNKIVERGSVTREPQRPPDLVPLWGSKANPDQNRMAFWATTSLSMTLHGMFLAMPDWTRGGRLDKIWPLDPLHASFDRMDDQGIRLRMAGQGELENHPGRRPEFIMAPLYQLPGQYEPVSPVRYAAELLGLGRAYERTAARFMGRGLNPSVVITTDDEVDDDDAERVSGRLSKAHGGADRAGGVAVIGGTNVKMERLTMSMADAEFVAQNKRVFDVTMALWKVPPTVTGMADKPSTWGAGISEFSRGWERFTLRPIVQRLQAAIESDVLEWVDDNLQFRFVFDSLLSASPKERTEIQRTRLMTGQTSEERILAQNDEPPFDDDETVYTQLSLATREDRELAQLRQRAQVAGTLIENGVAAAEAYRLAGLEVDPDSIGEAPTPGESATDGQ